MEVRKRKVVANLLILVMAFSLIFNTGIVQTKSAIVQEIVSWDISEANNVAKIPATSGVNKEGAMLTTFDEQALSFASGSVKASGWENGANNKYWEINFSTKGYGDLKLSAKTRSSGTGPSEFKVIYSSDGVKWNDVPNSEYKITNTTLSNYMKDITLPKAAEDMDNLRVRFVMTSNKTYKNGEVAKGGVTNINSICVSGSPVKNDTTVNGVEADIASGSAVALGQEVSLSCDTKDAVIKYSINNSEYTVYNENNKPKLTTLPATLVAYAEKAGLTSSVKITYTYTQGQVSAVSASPNGGSIKEGTKVELRSATVGSKIFYSLDEGATWNEYKEGFSINKLPQKVIAKAACEGLIDSNETTFNYSLKENENYTAYFGQLHSHTNLSDGAGTIDDAYTHASKVPGLDFEAVTDHSNWFDNDVESDILDGSKSEKFNQGKAAADKYTKEDFVAIYGYEMTWSNGIGHINTFNTDGFQSRNQADYKTSQALENYYKALKKASQSISQFNHPGTTFGDFNDFANYDPEIDSLINLVEVGNGEGEIGTNGYFPSYQYYTRALDKGWHVAPSNNQDNHKGKWGDANTARTVLLADSLTRDNLYDAMRNRRTYATEDANLKVNYTLNDEVMGTIMSEKPSSVNIKGSVEDPDGEKINTVKVIVNGGKELVAKEINDSKGDFSFELPADYSYYYIRVDEEDKDIAVTAPVWIGEVDKAGVNKTTSDAELPVKGESMRITSELYNNESKDMEVKSIKYSVNGQVINYSEDFGIVSSLSTKDYTFEYTPDKAGNYNIDVEIIAVRDGVEKVYNDVLKLNVTDPSIVTNVVIDGTHANDYVTGYYSGSMTNFSAIAAEEGVKVHIEKEKITEDMLKNANLLIVTAPAKKAGTGYKPEEFSDDFINMVKDYVDNGGNLVVSGLADYQDGKDNYQTSTQLNKLLQGIGATSRINNDEVVDDEKYSNQKFRLQFTNYNMESPYLSNVIPEQTYSFYSGCSVALDEEAVKAGKSTWLVKGHDTTYSFDSNKNLEGVSIPKGEVVALASEKLPGGGNMLISGTVFLSNYEVKAALDNAGDLQYSNYTIAKNLVNSVKKQVPITKVADVRKGNMGDVYKVEGTVTAGTESGNAFFDTIYVQDETGGINIFPINQYGIKLGQKVAVTGTLDGYLGDLELRVIDVEVTDESINKVEPKKLSAKEAMDYETNGGLLAKVSGKVSKVYLENGIVSYFMINDGSGVEAKVFIDGYINASDSATNLEELIVEGKEVSAIGLISYDPDGPRMRVRDRSEIVKVDKPSQDTPSEEKPSQDQYRDGNAGENNNSNNTGNNNGDDVTDNNDQNTNSTSTKTGDYGIDLITIISLLSLCVVVKTRKKIKA
mgnify:CR=1 FL=1